MALRAAATWTSRWVSTPPVISSGMVVMVRPFSCWVGVHQPAGTADKTTTGLLDRLLVGHFRPTGQYRVGVRARSTDRYQGNPRIESVSRNSLGQTWPGHPPGTLASLTS